QNTSTGNLSVTQNVTAGNTSFANVNVSATINTAANLVAGNIKSVQNVSTGNLSITQNTSGGNASFANVNVSATINTAANVYAGNVIVGQNISTGNLSVTLNASVLGGVLNANNIILDNTGTYSII